MVKYNAPEYEALCLESIAKYTHAPHHVTAYQNKKGIGLSSTWNKLIARSDAEYICLLNNDTIVTNYWLSRMLDVFSDEKNVGAITPASNAVGARMCVPINFNATSQNLEEINDFATNYWILNARETELRNQEGLSGFCLMFPKEVWLKSGMFDERFQFYYEDAEWTKRVHRVYGYDLRWAKGVYIHHYGSISMKKAHAEGEIDRIKTEIDAGHLCEQIINGVSTRKA